MPVIQRKQVRSDNGVFTGSGTVPALLALGTASLTVTVAPVVTGDILAVGEPVIAHSPNADLPAGILVGQARVTAQNQVKITVYALLALALATPVNWTITAQR